MFGFANFSLQRGCTLETAASKERVLQELNFKSLLIVA
jgi:hypothetical protein